VRSGEFGGDVRGVGCERRRNGGDLLLFVFFGENFMRKKKKKFGSFLFKYEKFKSVK
jgi:hypothetical protein